MDIKLTDEQKLQQTKINAFILDIENKLKAGSNVNLDLGNTLNGLFRNFDLNKDSKFNANEATSLVSNLRQINTEANIAKLFHSNGEFNFNTEATIDVTGDAKFIAKEDLVAITHIIDSEAARAISNGTINLAETVNAKFGTGNVFGGLKHFNAKGAFFVTESGFTIMTDVNVNGNTTQIYDKSGKMISRIWGDPHVEDDSGVRGDDWHFGDDSTFILPDGTEILFNTEGNSKNNIFATTGLYIISGKNVYHTGQAMNPNGISTSGRNSNISQLNISATEFDASYADQKSKFDGAGVFAWSSEANSGRGGWAVMTESNEFQDIAYESWSNYLKAGNETFDNQHAGRVNINRAQRIRALDGETVRIFDTIQRSGKSNTNVPGTESNSQDAFLDYHFINKASEKELTAYRNMLLEGASAERMNALDDFIKGKLDKELNAEEAEQYLNYLVNSPNLNLANSFLNIINNKPNSSMLDLLETQFQKTGSIDREIGLEEATLLDNLEESFQFKLDTTQGLNLEEARELFCEYCFQEAANSAELTAFSNMAVESSSKETMQALDEYIRNGDQLGLSAEQEEKYLSYLVRSENSLLADTYLKLIKNNAPESKFEILDEYARKDLNLSKEQESRFFNALESFDSTVIINKYLEILSSNQGLERLEALEDYENRDLKLNNKEEETFLDYLDRSKNTNIAVTYLNLLETKASSQTLKALNDIYLSNSTLKDPLQLEDLRFADQLNKLMVSGLGAEAATIYNKLVLKFDLNSPQHGFISSVLDKLTEVNASAGTSVNPAQRLSANRILLRDLASIVDDPTKTLVKLGSNADTFQARNEFLAKFIGPYANVALSLADAQINLLETMDQNNPKVKQAIAANIQMMDFSPSFASSNISPVSTSNGDVRLNTRQRFLYSKFESAHKSAHGGLPSKEQNTDFVQVVTQSPLWSNKNFMDVFINKSAKGKEDAVDDLLRIANYAASNRKFIPQIPISGLSDTAINYATKFIDFSTNLPKTSAYSSVKASVDSIMNYVLGASPRLKDAAMGDFINDSLDILKNKIPTVNPEAVSATAKQTASQNDGLNENEMSRLIIRNLNNLRLSIAFGTTIAPQSVDLIAKGDSTALKNSGLADKNLDYAKAQADIFRSIIDLYQSMISEENLKDSPNTSRINAYKSVISVYETAIKNI